MRVTPIPDDAILPGHERIIMRAPAEDLIDGTEVRDVELLIEPGAVHVFRARVVLEDGDLERLANGEAFWVSMWGGVVPFDVSMEEK